MYNYVMLIGKFVSFGDNKTIVLEIRSTYRNKEGKYTYEQFVIKCPEVIFEISKDNFIKGSTVSIKGFLRTNENGHIEIVAERIMLLSK